MRRKMLSLLLCLTLLAGMVLGVSAETGLPLVVDEAGLLTADEESALAQKAGTLQMEYGMDVVILTVEGLDGASFQDYADDYFDYNGYGYGQNASGVLFLLSMEERDWYISTTGDARYALTDYGTQHIGEEVVPYLSDGDYYGGFDAFLEELPRYFDAYLAGDPEEGYIRSDGSFYHSDRENAVYYQKGRSPSIVISLVIGLVAAGITIAAMSAAMNTKRKQSGAGQYLRSGSFRLRTQRDLFLYSRVNKTRRAENNHHGGGGSSVHSGSSGRSHGGGGGKF